MTKERFYYVQSHIMNSGLRWLNYKASFVRDGRYELTGGMRAGLPTSFSAPPELEVRSARRRSPPYDVEEQYGTWFVSERFKQFAESVDSDAFDFLPCDNSRLEFKGEALTYWACAPRRVGSFLDEANSEGLRFCEDRPDWRTLVIVSSTRIAVDRSLLGPAHLFSLTEARNVVFCDEHFRKQYVAAKFRPLSFTPT